MKRFFWWLCFGLYSVRCSWCGKHIRWATVRNSHGICEHCAEELMEAYREPVWETDAAGEYGTWTGDAA